MDLPITAVNQIVRTYQTQERIAELNRKNPARVTQSQEDRVTLSDEGRHLAETAGGKSKNPGIIA
jgi:thiamine biosynthesis lipoprotein ApbE